MPEHDPYSPAPAPAPAPALRGRRKLVLPAAAAALVLATAGTGLGYALARPHPTPSASAVTLPQGSSSRLVLPPGYRYDEGYPDEFGSGRSSDTSTDTTGEAADSQLTGLVRIVSTMKYDGATAAGTGMVLTSDGEVVTNHHVVEGATSVKVKLMTTGTTYTAEVVGTDASADVAVLQLEDASGLQPVSLDHDGVTQGEAVTAVGDGNGTVDHLSAATGSVIATEQQITTQSDGSAEGESLTGLIEISSDVVGGYSGGATYDADGEVVGMTTAASSGTPDPVGYAIPISTVTAIADDLESGATDAAYTYGSPAFLGIGLGETGTVVQGVYDGTPAADAGIEGGDTITRIDGTAVSTSEQLRAAIAAHEPGDAVILTWTDSTGSGHTATVTLGTGPVA